MGSQKKAIRTLLLLVNWEVLKERHARTFARKRSRRLSLFQKIKEEARSWGLAGAKHLAALLDPLWSSLWRTVLVGCCFCLFPCPEASQGFSSVFFYSYINRNSAQSVHVHSKKKLTVLYILDVVNQKYYQFPAESKKKKKLAVHDSQFHTTG